MQLRSFGIACGLFLVCASGLFAQEAISQGGVGRRVHPLPVGDVAQAPPLPAEQRDKVHIFIVNGLDPLYLGNLNGMAEYIQCQGFTHTHCYQMFHAARAERDIRALRQCDPKARVVLLGFSLGANVARTMTHSMGRDCINIDVLVYLGGDSISNTPDSIPANAGKVINITGHGLVLTGGDLFLKGTALDGATNLRVDTRHILLPSRTQTIEVLSQEVVKLAQQTAAPAPATAAVGQAQRVRNATAPTAIRETPPTTGIPGRLKVELLPPVID